MKTNGCLWDIPSSNAILISVSVLLLINLTSSISQEYLDVPFTVVIIFIGLGWRFFLGVKTAEIPVAVQNLK